MFVVHIAKRVMCVVTHHHLKVNAAVMSNMIKCVIIRCHLKVGATVMSHLVICHYSPSLKTNGTIVAHV